MNFGITKLKIIVTLIVSFLMGIFAPAYLDWGCLDCSPDQAFDDKIFGTILGFLAAFFPLYIIWSFFDKKPSSLFGKNIGRIITIVFVMIVLVSLFLFVYEKINYPNIH